MNLYLYDTKLPFDIEKGIVGARNFLEENGPYGVVKTITDPSKNIQWVFDASRKASVWAITDSSHHSGTTDHSSSESHCAVCLKVTGRKLPHSVEKCNRTKQWECFLGTWTTQRSSVPAPMVRGGKPMPSIRKPSRSSSKITWVRGLNSVSASRC